MGKYENNKMRGFARSSKDGRYTDPQLSEPRREGVNYGELPPRVVNGSLRGYEAPLSDRNENIGGLRAL